MVSYYVVFLLLLAWHCEFTFVFTAFYSLFFLLRQMKDKIMNTMHEKRVKNIECA